MSPFLKISPALMHIENLSLQSLARTQHGVGVQDLREALEGRGSSSNLALNSTSVRSLDYPPSSIHSKDHPELTRWRSSNRKVKGSPSDVREVLNKLGVGKNNGTSLLKASFPGLQRTDARCVPSHTFSTLRIHIDISQQKQILFNTSLSCLIFSYHPFTHVPYYRTCFS